ncbi:hypothetical protein BD769DRAFT_1467840 [Suillus cothurnatus]|nr:hypothetical protein BD769DRAFT_1467840 [Suillus cothurnatus]
MCMALDACVAASQSAWHMVDQGNYRILSRDALSRWASDGSATLRYSNHVYSFSLQEGGFSSNFGTADIFSCYAHYIYCVVIVQLKYWSVFLPGSIMSPPIVQYVVPKGPTILAGRESVDLPGYDLWLHFVDNVHAFDGSIDIERFHDALASTLQMYPHAAGKLCTTGGRWFIQLTNSGLAVEVEDRKEELSTSFIQGDWVIQDDLSSLLSQLPPDAIIVNGSASLVRFKITSFKDRTCLAVSWHHTLGDAVALCRFMQTLSLFYQRVQPDFSPPTFDKHQYRTPGPSTSSEFLPLMPHLWASYPFDELEAKYAEACEDLANLRWRFHEHHLHALHSMLSVNEENYVSWHDCLTAYIVTLLNRSMPRPIRMVTNVANFRRVEAHYIASNVAGNVIQNIPSGTLPSHMSGIAIAVRESIVRCRDGMFLEDWMAVASDIMLATANAGKSFFFASRPGVMSINSNVAIDWCDAHFGFPDSSSFFTTGSLKFYFRPFKSNPTLHDGTWRPRKGSVDVSMGVPRVLKAKLLVCLALDFETIFYRSP